MRKRESKVLGLIRKDRPINSDKDLSHGSLIDKYGYECLWNEGKLKSIAYRLQSIKYELVPEFIKKLVSAYFCGVLRFSSSIIWLRSTAKHRNRIRFYYCMAMASIMGLTAAEALNLTCCKNMSVRSSNKDYIRLLEETELPSMREMASLDAVSVVKQVSLLKPEWFRCGTLRQQVSARTRGESGLTTAVQLSCKGTLVEQLFNLKQNYAQEFGQRREKIKDKKDSIRDNYKRLLEKAGKQKNYNKRYIQSLYRNRKVELAKVDTPCLQYYFAATEFCTVRGKVDYAHLIRTYTLRSRSIFSCLDTFDRVKNFKTPARKHSDELEASPAAGVCTPRRSKSPTTASLSSNISSRNKRKIGDSSSSPKTSQISAKRSRIVLPCSSWSKGVASCNYCGVELCRGVAVNESIDSESHLLYVCTGIPNSKPLPKKNRRRIRDLMSRLAAISAVPDPGGDIP